jgi:hypothetical protein
VGIRAATRELDLERNEAWRALKINGLSDEAKKAAKLTYLQTFHRSLIIQIIEPTRPAQHAAAKVSNAINRSAYLLF